MQIHDHRCIQTEKLVQKARPFSTQAVTIPGGGEQRPGNGMGCCEIKAGNYVLTITI